MGAGLVAGLLAVAVLQAGVATQAPSAAPPPGVSIAAPGEACGGRSANPRSACPDHVAAMRSALPDRPAASPARRRTVLVLAHAAGYVHSSIPLAAVTVGELGRHTGAWRTTVTWDPADISAENLAQYDALVLDSTTGEFLDDPGDPVATQARRAALLAFVRDGKGLVGLHGATSSYRISAAARDGRPEPRADEPDDLIGTWPEFNTLIGGLFKFHWNDGQVVTYRVEEPGHPINASFRGHEPFVIRDETYTFAQAVYSRENLRVLTSVDLSAMSAADRAKEQHPRPDGDHPLSWVRREGNGRVFYLSHGHNEAVYANRVFLDHLMRGIQYALGDLHAPAEPR